MSDTARRPRLDSIDLVRGAVMVLMLLDHTRDFAHAGALFSDPLDPQTTTPIIYLTRWVTHLCAPMFVFLAGLGVGLRSLRGATAAEQTRFLWTRGLWLIALEIVVLRVLIWFNVNPVFLAHLQVIWAIGVSMVVLSLLVRLPLAVVAAIGAAIVVGHNALDGLRVPAWTGPESPVPTVVAKLWMLAHQGGFFPIAGFPSPIVWAHYPVLPWIGIMAIGYASSAVYTWPAERRRRVLLVTPVVMIGVFLVLRATNLYGDPIPWTAQGTLTQSIMAFMNVQKYPPSLLFALATLAPGVFALGWLDGRSFRSGLAGAIVTFGRVPLFFYLLQWPTAHLAGIAVTLVYGGDISLYFMHVLDLFTLSPIPVYGGPLFVTYLCWIAGVLLLYWPCRWFAGVKARRRNWWLSYM